MKTSSREYYALTERPYNYALMNTVSYCCGFKDGIEIMHRFYSDNTVNSMAEPDIDDEYDEEKVKAVVKAYFNEHDGDVIDYIDLVEALGLPLVDIVEACHALESEGRIAAVD